MTAAEIIANCARDARLPFLVIGGFAVIAHGYSRSTLDVDFLVRRLDREAWDHTLAAFGYKVRHTHENFAQYASTRASIDLDLMFVNERTFDGMFAASELKAVGPTMARFPSLEHLLALKLHVIKQSLPHRMLGDMDDIVNLVLANRIDLRTENWRQFFTKYGNLDVYEKVVRATQR